MAKGHATTSRSNLYMTYILMALLKWYFVNKSHESDHASFLTILDGSFLRHVKSCSSSSTIMDDCVPLAKVERNQICLFKCFLSAAAFIYRLFTYLFLWGTGKAYNGSLVTSLYSRHKGYFVSHFSHLLS